MENMTPLFSCVIPTKGRVSLVADLLDSLRSANMVDDIPLEIIVVDNSNSADASAIESLCRQYNAIFTIGTPSVREKRNKGIEMARGEYVFFIDSDCVADKHLFENHYALLSQAKYSACIGVTKFIGNDNFIWHVISNTRFLDSFNFPVILKGKVDSAPWGPTTNLSVKRDVLLQISGFETNLPFNLGADDADLGLRINKAGYKIGMAEESVVYHSKETWNGWRQIIRRVFRWGRMDYHLYYRRHDDKIAFTMPKPVTFFLLTIILQIFFAMCSSWPVILGVLFWPLFYFFFFATIKKHHWKMSKVPLRVLMCAEFINQVFDCGCMLMSLRHISLKFFFQEPVDDPRTIWHTKLHSVWASCISLFFITILNCVWLAFQ